MGGAHAKERGGVMQMKTSPAGASRERRRRVLPPGQAVAGGAGLLPRWSDLRPLGSHRSRWERTAPSGAASLLRGAGPLSERSERSPRGQPRLSPPTHRGIPR